MRWVQGRKVREDLYDSLGMGLEEKGRPQQVSCFGYRTGEIRTGGEKW